MNKKHSVYLTGIVGAGKSDTVVFTDIAKAGKMSVKIIKNFVKISSLILSLVFSLNSFGYKNITLCDLLNLDIGYLSPNSGEERYTLNKKTKMKRMLALVRIDFCTGKEKEGVEALKKASLRYDHIHASYLLGVHHAKLSARHHVTLSAYHEESDSRLFPYINTAIYYYEKAATRIISAINYPYGVNPDQPDWEDKHTTSAKVFVGIPHLYYEKYMKAAPLVGRVKKVSSTDPTFALVKMRDWSEQCLKRSALAAWKTYPGTANAVKAYCQATNNFAIQVLPLEQQRVKIVADQCKDVLPDECTAHQNIFNQITKKSDTMLKALDLVPRI